MSERGEEPYGFPATLRSARAEAGQTQRGLAKQLGFSQNAVARWEAGETEPSPRTVFHLEAVLGCTPGRLSSHLGYVPVGAVRECTVDVAVALDSRLTEPMKAALLTFYSTAVAVEGR